MEDKSKQLTTGELWAKLFRAPTIDHYFSENSASCEQLSFADYLTQLSTIKNEKPEQVIKRSGIERSFGYRLFSGGRNPSRDTVLQLSFGFALSPDEAQQLLKAAHMTPLHPKVKRDAVIAFCLHRKTTLIEAQQLLEENLLPLLGATSRNKTEQSSN